MLDLSRGLLSDEAFTAAEATRRSCPTCASWWEAHLTGPDIADLDRVVEDAFAAFTPPHQKRLSERYPWAVAAVLALGAGLVLQMNTTEVLDEQQVSEVESLVVQERIDSDSNDDGVIDLSDLTLIVSTGRQEQFSESPDLFGSDLESGDLSTWSGINQAASSESSS